MITRRGVDSSEGRTADSFGLEIGYCCYVGEEGNLFFFWEGDSFLTNLKD